MPPITVMIKPVSGACNMRCRYCFYADEMKNRACAVRPPMNLETLEIVVRRACSGVCEHQLSTGFGLARYRLP